ncbi:RNA polymerase sigma factor [Streptomyces nigra]|uniref:RNA polymerase sigma factor n=1 Tax=Streptomyces nigra TaxID=1827580 RepID=UPI00380A1FE4
MEAKFAEGEVWSAAERDDAFAQHVLPHVRELQRVAAAITSQRADAEDLVQDTLLSAYRAIDRFDGRFPRAWLLTILRRKQINCHRVRKPQLLADMAAADAAQKVGAGPFLPEDFVIAENLGQAVSRVIGTLPEGYQVVVRLVVFGGFSYAETAKILKVPEGTVMSRLYRARKRIRSQLSMDGSGHEQRSAVSTKRSLRALYDPEAAGEW